MMDCFFSFYLSPPSSAICKFKVTPIAATLTSKVIVYPFGFAAQLMLLILNLKLNAPSKTMIGQNSSFQTSSKLIQIKGKAFTQIPIK